MVVLGIIERILSVAIEIAAVLISFFENRKWFVYLKVSLLQIHFVCFHQFKNILI